MSNYRQKIAIIRDTDDDGNTYILDITNDVTKWHNFYHTVGYTPKELEQLQIEWTTVKIY